MARGVRRNDEAGWRRRSGVVPDGVHPIGYSEALAYARSMAAIELSAFNYDYEIVSLRIARRGDGRWTWFVGFTLEMGHVEAD